MTPLALVLIAVVVGWMHGFFQHRTGMAPLLVTLASLAGTAAGMVLTPILIETMPLSTIQLFYGGLAGLSTVLFLIFAREKPATPPGPPGSQGRALMIDGLKHALGVRAFWFTLAVAFIAFMLFQYVGDPVMPGCLGLDALWQLLTVGIFAAAAVTQGT